MNSPLKLARLNAASVWFACAVSLLCVIALPAAAETAHAIIIVPTTSKAPANLRQQVMRWQKSGQVSQVVWVDRLQEEDPAFASLITLEFPDDSVLKTWMKKSAPAIAAPAAVKVVELLTKGEVSPRDSSKAVFKVNIYQMKVPNSRYKEYAQGYIAPLMDGQVDAGLMTSYAMYGERGPVGQSNAVLVMEYRDPPTFVRVPAAKEKVRAQLRANHPTYPKFEGIKDSLRADVSESLGASGLGGPE